MRVESRVCSIPGSRAKGFTLLEVMVAMALFFLAVTVFSASYLNTLMAIESTQLNQGLEQDLMTIRREALLISEIEELEKGGDVVTGEHGTARWQARIEPTEVADLFEVILSISLDPVDQEKGVREAEERFYVVRPSWSDPLDRENLRTATRERLVDHQLNANR